MLFFGPNPKEFFHLERFEALQPEIIFKFVLDWNEKALRQAPGVLIDWNEIDEDS